MTLKRLAAGVGCGRTGGREKIASKSRRKTGKGPRPRGPESVLRPRCRASWKPQGAFLSGDDPELDIGEETPSAAATATPTNPPGLGGPDPKKTLTCGFPTNDATIASRGSVPADDGQPKLARPSHSVRIPAALLRRILMRSTSTASLPLW